MSKTIMTVVRVEWGEGYYKNGKLADYHKDKWEAMSPKDTIKLYNDCDVDNVKEVNMSGAEWEFSGCGFPDSLEDALNKDYPGDL